MVVDCVAVRALRCSEHYRHCYSGTLAVRDCYSRHFLNHCLNQFHVGGLVNDLYDGCSSIRWCVRSRSVSVTDAVRGG